MSFQDREAEVRAAMEAVGIDPRNPLEVLLRHHRNNQAATLGARQISGKRWTQRLVAAGQRVIFAAGPASDNTPLASTLRQLESEVVSARSWLERDSALDDER